jgi:hypothetical protein
MIETSEQTKELYEAFAKAQAAVEDALADNQVNTGKYKYTYADLRTVWRCCRKALAENQLAVAQFPRAEKCNVEVYTRLCHSSGQWMQGPPASCVANDAMPQAVGSAITYLKRYSLAALMGVAVTEEDDDGASGSGKDQGKPQGRSEKPQKPPAKPKASGSAADQAEREQYLKVAQDAVTQICGRITIKDGDDIVREWEGNVDLLLRYATGGVVDLEKWRAGKNDGNLAKQVSEALLLKMDGRNPPDVLKAAYGWEGAK